MEKDKLLELKEEILKALNDPDLDVDLCFDEGDRWDVRSYPYFKVKYVVEGHSVHEKEIDINPEYWRKDVKDLVSFVVFQVQQFKEEVDSVEYGGE